MAKELPGQLPSFYEETSEHLLREELDEKRLKRIFTDYAQILKAGKEKTSGNETFYNIRDKRVMSWLVEEMATPEGMISLREKIRTENPNLFRFMQLAEIQQRIAEHVISDPKATLEELGEKRRQYLQGESLGLAGPEGLASAIDLLGRAGYSYYYPDPLLDALFKVDLVAYDADSDTYFLIQLKTTSDLTESQVLCTPKEYGLQEREVSNAKSKQDDEKLKRDIAVLDDYSLMLSERYQENFVPLYWALPSLHSPMHRKHFDPVTGRLAKTRLSWYYTS